MSRRTLAVFSLLSLLFTLFSPTAVHADKIPALIVSGANNHDWKWTTPVQQEILEKTGKFEVDVTYEPAKTLADADALKKYKVFVLNYNGPRWGEPAESNFLNAVKAGTGVTVIHAADNAFDGWVEYEKLVGHCWRKGTGHGKFHSFDVKITDRSHPLTKDLPDLKAHPDELYHRLVHMHNVEYKVLATAFDNPDIGGTGNDEPMIIVLQYGQGRVFHTPLGHVWAGKEETRVSHTDPQFHLLIARGTEWAATGACTILSVEGAGAAPAAAACACKSGCGCGHCKGSGAACGCAHKKADAPPPPPAAKACKCSGCNCPHCSSGGQNACGCGG
jgi:type 1 glutamine amidotransferase